MRVVYSIGSHFGTTGISNTSYQAVKEIESQGHLSRLICLDANPKEIPPNKIRKFKLLKYLIWFPLKGFQKYIYHSFNPYIFLDKLYDYLAYTKIVKSDIFHYWRGHGKKSSERARNLGAKIFVENASSHPLLQNKLLVEEYKKHGVKFRPYSKKRLSEASEELAKADYIVVPKGFAYQSFIEYGLDKEKLVPVSFGIDLEKFEKFKKKKEDKKFRVIFVGQVGLRKGIQYLLPAWKKLNLKNSELVIVGSISSDAKRIVEKYKTDSSIVFTGQTNPLPYYSKSDIFVFPSIEEGSALVTYEAMACGLPQISTYNSGTVARNGKEGFIIPIRDIKAIEEKIKFFYDHPLELKKMSKNSLKEIKKYDWKNYGRELIHAYSKSLLIKV